MPYRESKNPPLRHGGPFDDPFMFPESGRMAEGASQRGQAVVAFIVIAAVLVVLALLTWL